MRKKEVIKIGKNEFTVLFPDLPDSTTDEENEAFRNDIMRNGILVPVIVDEKLGIIAGRRRARSASELDMKKIPFDIRPNLTRMEKREIAVTSNANHKQWTTEEKKQVAVILRKERFSLNRIANILAVGSETVRRWLNYSNEKDEFPDTVIGKDGIERPAKMPRKTVILARSANEAKALSNRLVESDATKDLKDEIIFGTHLDRKLNKAREGNKPDDIPREILIDGHKLWLGDFREECENIEDESIDVIDTDPPYGEVYIQLYEDLAQLASRKLKPGGLLLSYCGNMYLPQIHRIMSEYLEYLWTFAVRHTGGNTPIHNVKLFQSYKPLICYYKPPLKISWTPFVDMTTGGRSKSFHRWEQPESESEYFLSHLFPQAGKTMTLLDPMMGSANVILAGINLGMQCIGIDIDSSAYATAKQRVEHLLKKKDTDAA